MFSKNSKITKIKEIKDALIIDPSNFEDHRGSIRTIFDSTLIKDLNIKSFNHTKLTYSYNNVFRGFHGDIKSWKLIKCIQGNIDQYIFDFRIESETYGNLFKIKMSHNEESMVLIPPGCLNGFHTLSDSSTYLYNLSYEGNYIDSADQITLAWNDPRINLKLNKPILQLKDQKSNS
jgi:dTDP-4-dehydrorhamnose 3,5-epimerase